MNGAKSFRYSKIEVIRILKVFGWTMASALVALALQLMEVVELPAQYVFLVPAINFVLYALNEFITNNKKV
jgi:hypothetical protein